MRPDVAEPPYLTVDDRGEGKATGMTWECPHHCGTTVYYLRDLTAHTAVKSITEHLITCPNG